jgi:hexosaminidase
MTEPHGSDSWSGHLKTWAHILSFDPYACTRSHQVGDHAQAAEETDGGVKVEEKRKKVLGGQACSWTEQTDKTNLDCGVWPRAGAVADLFWTGDSVGGGYPRSKSASSSKTPSLTVIQGLC